MYNLFAELNNLLQAHNFKFNSKFDFTSNKLDTIINSFNLRKIKQHSIKSINTALAELDSEKIANLFLSANREQQLNIKANIFSKM